MVNLDEYKELTGKIIGGAMQVHSALGSGFQEVIYQRSLAIELEASGISFEREIEVPVYYKDKAVGARKVDFLVEKTILVELKAVNTLTDQHYNQIINYLEAFRLPIGLLINFGESRLTFKRFVKTLKK